MTPEKTENLRLAILSVLSDNDTRFGLGVDPLRLFVKNRFGIDAARDQLLDELQYLGDRTEPLIESVAKVISRENRAWRITSAGLAYIDRHA